MAYILYKNPIQLETLAIVQYLHSIGCDVRPFTCIERNHPDWVTELPSIETNSKKYIGLNQCISFYEEISNFKNLLSIALQFKNNNPDYRSCNKIEKFDKI